MSTRRHRGAATSAWLAAACSIAALHPSGVLADLITGYVRDGAGAPVANADFDFFDAAGEKLPYDGDTHTTGRYEVFIDPGRYDVVVQPPIGTGLAPRVTRGVRIDGTTTLDWTLPPSFRVLGRVRGPANQPLSQARLEFDRLDDGTRQPSLGNLTNPFGSFAAYIEGGDYRVTAIPADADSAIAPGRIPAIHVPGPDTLKFALVPALHLSGTVVDSRRAPVAGARLAFDDSGSVRIPATGRQAGADGVFRAGIAPGAYRVTVEPPPGTRLVARRIGPIDLFSDQAIEVGLSDGWLVTGRVTIRGGLPLVGADWDAADEATQTSVPTPNDNTDEDGRFSIVLGSGSYRLRLSPPAGSGLDTLVFHDVAVGRDTSIDVDYGQSAPVPAATHIRPLSNPTHRVADLSLALERDGWVRVEVFSASGRRLRLLADEWLPAGSHPLHWDGNDNEGNQVHAGVYFVRMKRADRAEVGRVVLLP